MSNETYTVKEDGTVAQLTAGLRQILLVGGGWAVGKGYLDSDTLTAIVTVSVILVPLVYGQVKQWRAHEKLVAIAEQAPNAEVVQK